MGSGPYTVAADPSCSSTATPLSPPPPYVDVKVEDEDVVLEEEMAEPPVVDHNAVHTQSTQSTQVSSVSSSPSDWVFVFGYVHVNGAMCHPVICGMCHA